MLFLRHDFLDRRFAQQRNVVFFMPCQIADDDFLFRDLLAQQRRKRDPIVERVRLIGEHGNGAGRVGLAQLLCGGRAGKSIADDYVVLHGGPLSPGPEALLLRGSPARPTPGLFYKRIERLRLGPA